jgi:hypothetical protein
MNTRLSGFQRPPPRLPPDLKLPMDRYFIKARAMTMRWISLVPS